MILCMNAAKERRQLVKSGEPACLAVLNPSPRASGTDMS